MRRSTVFTWKESLHVAAMLGVGSLVLASGEPAFAQIGSSNVPLPNVMLLLDTSGSFEKMIDGTDPEAPANNPPLSLTTAACTPGMPSLPNRWGVAVQALTGSIQPFYSCAAMNRTSAGFFNQYAITKGSPVPHAPYDASYYLPFHRPLAYQSAVSSCAYTPYALPGAVPGEGVGVPPIATSGSDCSGSPCQSDDFPPDAIGQYTYDTFLGQTVNLPGNTCTFNQLTNGAIDGATTLMRFGLMTFDNDPQPGIGVTASTTPMLANTPTSPFDGMWSYFAGWNGVAPIGGPIQGWPVGCSTRPYYFELGARNPAAPPWEGRLVTFPDPWADTTGVSANNDNVQLAVNAMRPYGGTPIAAMLDDAEQYYWADAVGPQANDPFVTGNCRDEFIILLTDGQPNQDLRAACAATGTPNGQCPYNFPDQIAASMYGNGTSGADNWPAHLPRGGHSVKTFVIGFAVSQLTPPPAPAPQYSQCSQLVTSGTLASVCTTLPVPTNYQACCTLQQIAVAGGTGSAYFADTPGDLNAALGAVLGQITKRLASQTLPTYSPTTSYTGAVNSEALYLASFNGAVTPWRGDVQRQQLTCQAVGSSYNIVKNPTVIANGDDFLSNLQVTSPSARRFLAYSPPGGAGSNLTIRPYITTSPDGLTPFGNTGAEIGLGVSAISYTNLPPTALNITSTTCQDPVNRAYLSANDCDQVMLNFATAQTSVSTPSDPGFVFASRCPSTGPACNPLGAIIHSTPSIAPTPSSLLRDDSYQGFANSLSPGVLGSNPRPPVLYVATTDGLLHAFDTTVSTESNNELWAFIPPGIMPNLQSSYPAASAIVLDGAAQVKDVVWDRWTGGPTTACPNGWPSCWHSMLVAGFGGGGRGYYALDVTDPRYVAYTAPSYGTFPPPALRGPHFEWQLSSMTPPGGPPQREIFGLQAATPVITTVFADPSGGSTPHEIGVAILPGGSNGRSQAGGPCQRALDANSGAFPSTKYDLSDPLIGRRGYVRKWASKCYGAGSDVPGRSVTIVRIDTGAILAVFTRGRSFTNPDAPDNLLAGAPSRVIDTPLDSPMTGVPVVFPSDIGTVAQKFYMGDADGTMWRFDLTSTNPANWYASVFVDAYGPGAEQGVPVNQMASDSAPIQVSPLVTLDSFGDTTIQFSTGDTSTYGGKYTLPGTDSDANDQFEAINYVYSVLETGPSLTPTAQVNWFLRLRNGERVSGPMAVFDSTFYFATFDPPLTGAACSGGVPRIWALDYLVPGPSCPGVLSGTCPATPTRNALTLANGGNPRNFLLSATPGVVTSPPDETGAPTVGVVIPGLSVNFSPACVGGSGEVPSLPMLSAIVGRGAGGALGLGNIAGGGGYGVGATSGGGVYLSPAHNTTNVDSWAAMTE